MELADQIGLQCITKYVYSSSLRLLHIIRQLV